MAGMTVAAQIIEARMLAEVLNKGHCSRFGIQDLPRRSKVGCVTLRQILCSLRSCL